MKKKLRLFLMLVVAVLLSSINILGEPVKDELPFLNGISFSDPIEDIEAVLGKSERETGPLGDNNTCYIFKNIKNKLPIYL